MAADSRRGSKKKSGARSGASPKPLSRGGRASPQEAALADVTRVLAQLDAPSAVIGGIAVIAWGHARLTTDIDCAIAASTSEVRAILRAFERGGFEAREEDAVGFAEANLVLVLRHRATGVDIDVSLAQLEFELVALRSSVSRKFGRVSLQVPRVTDLLIYKLVAGRPKDYQDVEELLALGLDIDADRIAVTLAEFDAMLDTNRLGEWQLLWREFT